MGLHVPFIFRNKPSSCTVYIDSSATPRYLFIELKDQGLIDEFGADITVKTDFERRLPKQDDCPELVALREVIFHAIKHLPEFLAKKKLAKKIARYSSTR
jgi:hypothetical protein